MDESLEDPLASTDGGRNKTAEKEPKNSGSKKQKKKQTLTKEQTLRYNKRRREKYQKKKIESGIWDLEGKKKKIVRLNITKSST